MPTGKILGLKCMTMEGFVPIDQGSIAVVPYWGYYSTCAMNNFTITIGSI
jgi:hypothetical protein